MAVDARSTTSTPELQGIKLPADGGPAIRVRVSLVVKNDPIARTTNTGTRVCELDCENDDEERVRITVWREYADKLAAVIKRGDLVQFSGLSAKKVFSARFAYGALPYAFHYGNGSNYTVVDANYRQVGMPVTAVADLQADVEFLQQNLADPRVRIRRVKARVIGNGLSPFCQGVVGPVLAYDQFDHSNSISLKVQIDFVPAEKRKMLTPGTLLEMRGMVALPQLEGDPAEFRVASFDDVNLFDNGLGPWLAGSKSAQRAASSESAAEKDVKQTGDDGSSPKIAASRAMSVAEVVGTELTKLKGVALDNFEFDASQGTCVGSVYVKHLRSDVTVSVHNVPGAAKVSFKEGWMLEMRGVLYDEGDQKRVEVAWPQIARSGKLPKLAQPALPPAAQRAFAVDLRSESSGLKIVTGKLLSEGEQRGTKAYFDVFVKDGTGKCVLTVVVIGDHRDVDVAACVGKDVDWKGVMKTNGAGDLEFIVAGWIDVVPSGVAVEKALESPSVVAIAKNFDFMTTSSPSNHRVGTADATTAVLTESTALAVANVCSDVLTKSPSSEAGSAIKEETLADVANDPSFKMMQSGGGQIPAKNRRSLLAAPPPRPRSTRKSKTPGSDETPTKKAKPSNTSKGTPRRSSTWQQELDELKAADRSAGALEESNGSVSSATTFSDAVSNVSTAKNTTANRRLDFSAFIDDQAEETAAGNIEDEEPDEEEGEVCV